MAMGGVDANLDIDSKIGVDAESRCQNQKWTKNSASDSRLTIPGFEGRTVAEDIGETHQLALLLAAFLREFF